jgi:hypothetical protein
MLNFSFGAVGAGAASRYGSGSKKMMRLLAASDLQHWATGQLLEFLKYECTYLNVNLQEKNQR